MYSSIILDVQFLLTHAIMYTYLLFNKFVLVVQTSVMHKVILSVSACFYNVLIELVGHAYHSLPM